MSTPTIPSRHKIGSVSVSNAGDLQFKAQVDAAGDSKCAGAVFKVYEVNEKGEKTELPDYTVSAAKMRQRKYMPYLEAAVKTVLKMKMAKLL